MRTSKSILTLAAALITTSAALGDWNPGDPCKMHSPQRPDPVGWDVDVTSTVGYPMRLLADDFLCTETGPLTGVHF